LWSVWFPTISIRPGDTNLNTSFLFLFLSFVAFWLFGCCYFLLFYEKDFLKKVSLTLSVFISVLFQNNIFKDNHHGYYTTSCSFLSSGNVIIFYRLCYDTIPVLNETQVFLFAGKRLRKPYLAGYRRGEKKRPVKRGPAKGRFHMAKEQQAAANEAVGQGAAAEGLRVFRELYTAKKSKKKYYGYFVKGLLRGHEVRADIQPPKDGYGDKATYDRGGFDFLGLLFEGTDDVFIERESEEYTSDDGRHRERVTYTAWSADVNGEVLKAPVIPQRPSDETKLKAMFGAM
jgi:hypothetical protein